MTPIFGWRLQLTKAIRVLLAERLWFLKTVIVQVGTSMSGVRTLSCRSELCQTHCGHTESVVNYLSNVCVHSWRLKTTRQSTKKSQWTAATSTWHSMDRRLTSIIIRSSRACRPPAVPSHSKSTTIPVFTTMAFSYATGARGVADRESSVVRDSRQMDWMY